MCCSHLSMLQGMLTEEQIEKLRLYFLSLIGGAQNNITVSKVSNAINIPHNVISQVLTKCVKEKVLDVSYAIRCPECNMLLKRVDSFSEILETEIECYGCNEIVEITVQDIEVIYSLRDASVFIAGQQEKEEPPARSVVLEDSVNGILLAGGINEYLFKPTDEQYKELVDMYDRVKQKGTTTKKTGDTLENLTEHLFNMCEIFRVAGIRTITNQIDCCVRNKLFINFGVFKMLGGRFIIECKNEGRTPKGEYLSKLHSIISIANAGSKGECIKFGIIISKKKGPKTFKQLATKLYLSEGIVIISICGDELENLFQTKGNLLEMIERKATEIMLDATTDLHEAGLYES